MQSLNARFQVMALLAIAIALIILPLVAMAAMTPAQLDDDGKPIPKRAPVHHVAPTDQQREVDALKAEVQKLRIEAEMCRAAKAAK